MLVDKTIQLECKGRACIIYLCAEDDKMQIIAEDRAKAKIWMGNFSPRVVEDLTTKTGNFKRYHTFVKMLLTGLESKSDSVRVRLLASSQLDELKGSRRVVKFSRVDIKKYLVLTYKVEFDIVNYVLPLQFQEIPDSLTLLYILTKYRAEFSNAAFKLQNIKDQCESQDTQKLSTFHQTESREIYKEEENDLLKLREINKLLEEKIIQLEFQREKFISDLSSLVKSNNSTHVLKELKILVNKLKGDTTGSDYNRIKKAKELLGNSYYSVEDKSRSSFEISGDSPGRRSYDKSKPESDQPFKVLNQIPLPRKTPSQLSLRSSSSNMKSDSATKTRERHSIGASSRKKSPTFASKGEGGDISDIQVRLNVIRTMLNIEN
jgi:hypothetical protein